MTHSEPMPRAFLALALILLGTAVLAIWGLAERERANKAVAPDKSEARAASNSPSGTQDIARHEGSGRTGIVRSPDADRATGHAPLVDASGPERTAEVPAEPRTFTLRALVLSLDGAPIAGAEARDADRRLARTDAKGRMEARVELEPQQHSKPGLRGRFDSRVRLQVLAPGYARVDFELRPVADSIVQLGTVRLALGTDVAGRVVDERGAPLEGASVVYRPAESFPKKLERARLHGVYEDNPTTRPWTRSDSEGRFELRGIPLGPCFLVAEHEGPYAYGWSEIFEAGPFVDGRAPQEVEIRLPPALVSEVEEPSEVELRLDVRAPDGTPLAEAFVRTWSEESMFTFPVRGPSPITLSVERGARFTLEARDPRERYVPAVREHTANESGELMVVLEEGPRLSVRMVDGAGAPVAWGHVRLEIQTRPWPVTAPLLPLGQEGRSEMRRPEAGFTLEGFAPGYRRESFGPFDPTSVDETLVLTMRAGGTLVGRVVHDGAAVSDATLTMTRSFAPEVWGSSSEGTPDDARFAAHGRASWEREDARTDREGRFAWSVHDEDWFSIGIHADGFPDQVRGPYQLSPGDPVQELELELERAGSLEGRVRVSAGNSLAGQLVAISQGWDRLYSTTTDENGLYRFDDLPPGRYQVRPGRAPLRAVQSFRLWPRTDPAPLPFPEDVRVFAQATARFDLDLTDASVVVRGRIVIGERRPDGKVSLHPVSEVPVRQLPPLAAVPMDSDGSFELRVREPGPYRLLWDDGWSGWQKRVVLRDGPNDLRFEPPVGRLRIRRRDEQDDGVLGLRVETSREDTTRSLFFHTQPSIDPGEALEILDLPIGTYRAVATRDSGFETEIVIREGETTLLELP